MEKKRRVSHIRGAGYDGRKKVIDKFCKVGRNVSLIREPQNIKDKNAICVYVRVPILFGALGYMRKEIGFIPAGTAKTVSKLMDAQGVKSIKGAIKHVYTNEDREFPEVSIYYDI